jgi:hypothetical protein
VNLLHTKFPGEEFSRPVPQEFFVTGSTPAKPLQVAPARTKAKRFVTHSLDFDSTT